MYLLLNSYMVLMNYRCFQDQKNNIVEKLRETNPFRLLDRLSTPAARELLICNLIEIHGWS